MQKLLKKHGQIMSLKNLYIVVGAVCLWVLIAMFIVD